MQWGWYLANDMQFYVIAPIILFTAYRYCELEELPRSIFTTCNFTHKVTRAIWIVTLIHLKIRGETTVNMAASRVTYELCSSFIYLFICFLIYLFIYLIIYLFNYLFIYLFIHSFVDLFNYLVRQVVS